MTDSSDALARYQQQHGYYLEDLSIGMSALFAKTFSEADLVLFAGASGDTNPLHMNAEFAAHSRFKRRIVHGMLTTSLWSTIVGTKLPGPGCAYMGQEIRFHLPVHIGDTVSATLTVTAIDLARQQVVLAAEAKVGDQLVASGDARVWVPRRSVDDQTGG
jgi:3-hydroxybutyryl-CoA dehydratase